MKKIIENILVPVKLDSEHLAIVKQVAELAKEHESEIHLLYMAETAFAFGDPMMPWYTMAKYFYSKSSEKKSLLMTWKRWVEKNYGIKVTVAVDWGSWQKGVLGYAERSSADLIILKEQPAIKKWFWFGKTPAEYVMSNSPCQVITLSAKNQTMMDWKQIVIPVTNFIPELRIKTIINIAKALKLKIHLITISPNEHSKQSRGFYFLTETLKRLKPSANIQVECKCLSMERNPAYSFLKYSGKVGADVLMTSNV